MDRKQLFINGWPKSIIVMQENEGNCCSHLNRLDTRVTAQRPHCQFLKVVGQIKYYKRLNLIKWFQIFANLNYSLLGVHKQASSDDKTST